MTVKETGSQSTQTPFISWTLPSLQRLQVRPSLSELHTSPALRLPGQRSSPPQHLNTDMGRSEKYPAASVTTSSVSPPGHDTPSFAPLPHGMHKASGPMPSGLNPVSQPQLETVSAPSLR
eukprot:6486373-Amphidinium_carterae.1